MEFKGFIGGAYRSSALPISAQNCINWYPIIPQNENASTAKALRPSEGYKEIATLTSANEGSFCRGMFRTSKGLGVAPSVSGSVIAIMGSRVVWFKSDNTEQMLGTISDLNAKAYATDDGFGFIIADGLNIYRLNISTLAFDTISFGLTDPTQVEFFGGYTVVIGNSAGIPQNTIFFSNEPYNNSSWNALDYFSAEASQDPVLAITSLDGYLVALGSTSYEFFVATDDPDLPFRRAYASTNSVGIYAPDSICKIGGMAYFVGISNQGSIKAYRISGTNIEPISDDALAEEWASVNTRDCTSWVESIAGHDFVFFNFDELDKTYVFDATTNEWHQRATRDPLTNIQHRWAPNYSVQIEGKTLIGDRQTTKIYDLSSNYRLENGLPIVRVRTTAHLKNYSGRIRLDKLLVDMVTGNGITDEDLSLYTQAPNMSIRISEDFGRTFYNVINTPFGATGEYRAKAEFRRLGVYDALTIEFSVSDAVQTTILAGDIDVTNPQIVRRG